VVLAFLIVVVREMVIEGDGGVQFKKNLVPLVAIAQRHLGD